MIHISEVDSLVKQLCEQNNYQVSVAVLVDQMGVVICAGTAALWDDAVEDAWRRAPEGTKSGLPVSTSNLLDWSKPLEPSVQLKVARALIYDRRFDPGHEYTYRALVERGVMDVTHNPTPQPPYLGN